MKTFTVMHGVDFRTGVANIGKCHVVDKAQELLDEQKSERIKEMQKKNKIVC